MASSTLVDSPQGKLLLALIGAGGQHSLTPAMQEEACHQGLRLH